MKFMRQIIGVRKKYLLAWIRLQFVSVFSGDRFFLRNERNYFTHILGPRKWACPTVLAPSSFRSSQVWRVVLLSLSAHLSSNLWSFHLTNSILFSNYSLKASYFTTEGTSFSSTPLRDNHKWRTEENGLKLAFPYQYVLYFWCSLVNLDTVFFI